MPPGHQSLVIYSKYSCHDSNKHSSATLQDSDFFDIRLAADTILDLSIELSIRVNTQLLEPISEWIDDPDFMKRHADLEKQIDWKGYKQKQREWSKWQKFLAAERLKAYWREIRTRRDIISEMAGILKDSKFQEYKLAASVPILNINFLSPLLKPFCPEEQSKRETERQFFMAERSSPVEILPWRIILKQQIKHKMNFEDLPQYIPDKSMDKIAKFINLLNLESEGQIKICQDEPFGQVSIQPINVEAELEGSFIVKDREGLEYNIDWEGLSDAQRAKVIADGLNNKILCKVV